MDAEEREVREIDGNGGENQMENLHEAEGEAITMKRLQPWRKQITIRGIIASIVIGCINSVILMQLNLTTGLDPNLNVAAALLAYVMIRGWTAFLRKIGVSCVPFTQQENVMIQTAAVACYSIALGGGFGSYLLGMNKKTYEQTGIDTAGNGPGSYKEPGLGWMISYLFLVSFIGLFALIPLRKILIVDYRLTYPSGMATAVLIQGFHAKGDKMTKKQVRSFTKLFSASFLWGLFKWFYSGKGDCGFSEFPTFGLKALKQTFYFDFGLTFVGTGMICPHIVNLSMLFGAVISWGMLWPLVHKEKGRWFPADIPESSMKSLNGYKVFVSISLLLGDGLYSFLKITGIALMNMYRMLNHRNIRPDTSKKNITRLEDLKQDEVFMKDSIPMWIAATGYAVFAFITAVVIPFIFPQVKWYYVVVAYIFAPSLAFCNAYGAGLTDINMAYNYGKVGLFVMAALAGRENGVIAGLVGCGLVKTIIYGSCTLMQDFKTGHLTYSSPRAMFVSQAIGTAVGCVVGPLSFFLFYRAFDIGNPNGEYKAPFALVYRNMAVLGVQGFSALPQHCLHLCYGFFAFAVGVNMVKDISSEKIGKWMPLPMVMALPFLIGANVAIDMCIGSLIVYTWQRVDPAKVQAMVPAVASGLICGEGLWALPASILALARVNPPMCMNFLVS